MSNNEDPNPTSGRELRPFPPLETIFRRRHILITGGTGFLGKVLLYLLLRDHPEIERIFLLIRGDVKSSLNRYRREILDSPVLAPLRAYLGESFDTYVDQRVAILPGDITEPGLVSEGAEVLREAPLDAVIHCAGLVNFDASLEKALSINVIGVEHVVEFCRQHQAALLHVSTCYAAGAADGHRYEDDVPVNWAPLNRPKFNLRREIRDALTACERVESESRDQAHQAEFRQSGDDLADTEADQIDEDNGRPGTGELLRKRWVEERLKEVGRERARRWGWPNTYSYTKSLGEQLVITAGDSLAVTIARPSVIESALTEPQPGWNQGVNTSAPLTYMSGRGYRFYPARPDLVLDIIPVDFAAHAMIPILGALLLRRHKLIYQLCTSDVNPLPMRRLVELTALANRLEHRRQGGGPMGKLAPHFEAVVASQRTYDLASKTLPAVARQAAGVARTLLGEESPMVRRFERGLDEVAGNAELARSLVEIYRPYIQELVYTFHGRNVRELYRSLAPGDAERHPFRPDLIDWKEYWLNVHLPGLRRHIFPQLDLHTRTRPRSIRRNKTLTEMLDRAAERYGARPAIEARTLWGHSNALSYRELRDAASRAGLLLNSRGIKPEDRVFLISENSPDWVIGYFAILYAGAIAVPLDHLIGAEELAPLAQIAEPRAMLLSAACADRLGAAGDSSKGITEIRLDELRRPFMLRGRSETPPPLERKSIASIVFTSGTTGTPKGVILTHGNFASEVMMLSRVFALDSSDVVLSLLPLHHTFEFTCGMLLPLASGARIVYPIGVDVASLSRTLADVQPTALIGVPALWEAVHRRILDDVDSRGPFFAAAFGRLRDLNRALDADYHLNLGTTIFRQVHAALGGRLRLAVSGGAPLPHRVSYFFNDLGLKLIEGYGLTESAPVLSVARPDEPLVAGSVGKPLSGIEIKVESPDDIGVGEIVARGPNVMSGYYRNAEATAEVLQDGWLRTGDLGRFDQDGRLYIVGRAKDVIVDSGGNNIYIDELEEAYGHSPYIKELAVVGLEVARGEQVAALVVPAYARGESRRTVEDRLREHFEKVSASLSSHKRIRILRFSEAELPRTRTRKVKRTEVAATLKRMLQQPGGERKQVSAEITSWLAHALQQVATEATEITPATRLIEDLGLDSLALAELAEQIAVKSGRELSGEQLANLSTIGDLQALLAEGVDRPQLPSYAHLAQPYTIALPQPFRRLGQAATRWSLHATFDHWLKPRIMGAGNVPANRNVLVVANHSSHADFGLIAYSMAAQGKDLIVLAAKDYFFNTQMRRFLATNFTHLIPFDREKAQIDSLDDALMQLNAGRNVLMFPEGTRSPDGQVHDFKSGAGYLALHSGCDILPIRIIGTHEVLGKGKLIPRRAPVEVRIGSVIPSVELQRLAADAEGAGVYRRLAEHMRNAVLTLTERPPRKLKPGVSAPTPHEAEHLPHRGRRASKQAKA